FSVWYGGLGPGLFATFISLLATDYLLIPPLFHFSKPWSFQGLHKALFAGVNILMVFLTAHLRKALIANNQNSRELLVFQDKIFNILQSVQGCFFTVDRSGNFVYLNDGCRDYLKNADSFLGKNVWQAFPGWRDTEFGKKFDEAVSR